MMPIEIRSILFNSRAASGAAPINLRFDAGNGVPLPEWTAERNGLRNSAAGLSPAAFTLAAIRSERLQIQARFQRTENVRTVWIKAAQTTGLLGAIPAFRLDFRCDRTRARPQSPDDFAVVTIPLDSPTIDHIDVQDQHWTWHWSSSPHGGWNRMRVTKHRIFIILDTPGPPWAAESHDMFLWPWTAVLEKSCVWARGARTPDEASDKITEAFTGFGDTGAPEQRMFRYDGLDTFSSFVLDADSALDNSFDLERVLETVDGDPNGIHKVNCSDVACCVTTFSNILGCRLEQVMLRPRGDAPDSSFITNALQPLGATELIEPLRFSFHEVAWRGPKNQNGLVWDATFRLADPATAGKPKIPESLSFGRPGSGQYLDQLARPMFRANLQPRPSPGNRPILPVQTPARALEAQQDDLSALFDLVLPERSTGPRAFAWGFVLEGVEFEKWHAARIDVQRSPSGRLRVDSYWRREPSPRVTIRVDMRVEHNSSRAEQITLRRLANAGKARQDIGLTSSVWGNMRVTKPDDVVAVGKAANLAYSIRNVGFSEEGVQSFRETLEDLVFGVPSSPLPPLAIRTPPPRFRTDVRIDLPSPVQVRRWYKLFSETGDFFSQAGHAYYAPGPNINHVIEIYAMESARAVAHGRIEFDFPP